MTQVEVIPAVLDLQKRVAVLEGGKPAQKPAVHPTGAQTVKIPNPPRK